MTKSDLINLATLITMRLMNAGMISNEQNEIKKVCDIICDAIEDIN